MPVSTGRPKIKRKMHPASRRFLAVLAVATVLMSGCALHRPDDVLSSRKMESVLYDYHLALAMTSKLPYEERMRRVEYENYVLQKNNITKAELDSSLIWYTRNPKELHKIYENLNKRIEKDENAAAARLEKIEKKSFRVLSGDSVDLWYLDRTRIMTMSSFSNPLLFEITPDTTFYRNDSIQWTIYATFLGPSADSLKPSAYLSLSLYYPDSISTADTIIRSDCVSVLGLQSDAGKSFDKLCGSVVYMNHSGNDSLCLMVSGASLLRTHVALPDSAANDTILPDQGVLPADSL